MQAARKIAEMEPPFAEGALPDLGTALRQTIDRCGATGQSHATACWTRDSRASHHYEIRAAPVGSGDVVLFVHETVAPRQPAPPAGASEPLVAAPVAPDANGGLTARQLDVLRLVACGATDKEVAARLGISTFTASKHVANILSKMHVSCRTEASVLALQSGMLKM